MIANKYKIIEKLNEGRFGSIFKCENTRTKELVAVKMELTNSSLNLLKNEAKIYQYLGDQYGIPRLKWFGKFGDYTYLAIDLLGSSLSQTIKQNGSMPLNNVITIGIQMLSILKAVHNKYLLHRDIKPDNFMFSLTNNKLYLIDFGLAKRYDYNGTHIPENRTANIIGSPNFVSLNVHNKIEPSRRDDVESCVYIMLYMILGRLYWFNTDIETMVALKKDVINVLPVSLFIKNMLLNVRNMSFEERPDYDLLINILQDEMNDN